MQLRRVQGPDEKDRKMIKLWYIRFAMVEKVDGSGQVIEARCEGVNFQTPQLRQWQ